jgi:hypothetical protein
MVETKLVYQELLYVIILLLYQGRIQGGAPGALPP